MKRRWWVSTALLASLALTACGGGGGGVLGANTATVTGTITDPGGADAADAAVPTAGVAASVVLTNGAGVETKAPIGAGGAFSVNVEKGQTFTLTVEDAAGNTIAVLGTPTGNAFTPNGDLDLGTVTVDRDTGRGSSAAALPPAATPLPDDDNDGIPNVADNSTDQDGDGLLDLEDKAPFVGIQDIPTESPFGASPLYGANPFEQQMILFEEFGPEPMPTVAASNWMPLPPPEDATGQLGPDRGEFDEFLRQPGVSPLPTEFSNVYEPSPWKDAIEAYLGRALIDVDPTDPLNVPGPAEGRPAGEAWSHQRWNDLAPKKFYKTAVAQSRPNQGLRDSKQMHGYALGEFAHGGLYHHVYTSEVPGNQFSLNGTTEGISIKFHPNWPEQFPNSIWTFDGTLPPKLLMVRYGESLLMRNYNALPLDPTATGGIDTDGDGVNEWGFGRHTISTHEHNGHQPGESDGFAGAFFFPGQFYDYRWPLQLAGYSQNNNAAGAVNYDATDPKAATPCQPGETLPVLVNGVVENRACENGTIKIPGDWRETMSTHWFHDHMIEHTSENVYKGNAAAMHYYSALDRGNEAVDDGVNLRFPSGTALPWGNRDYDVTVVVADKAFINAPGKPEDGQLFMNTLQRNGFLGDVMTANFLYKPYFDVRARRYRFRILNGSVSRIMSMALVHEIPAGDPRQATAEIAGENGEKYNRVPFHMIANDGNVMEHAVPFDGNHDYGWGWSAQEWKGQLPSQTIAERYDIVVDFAKHGIQPGDKLYFINNLEHADGKGTKRKVPLADILSGAYKPMVLDGVWINGDPGVGKFLQLRVHAYAGQDQSVDPVIYEPGGQVMIPTALDRENETVNGLPLAEATHHTYEYVRGGSVNGGHGVPWAIKVDGGTAEKANEGVNLSSGSPTTANIKDAEDGPVKSVNRISTIETGELEVFTIKTGGGWTHPVHIHFEEGIILTRGGKTPPAWEIGARKDMYRIGPEKDSDLEVEIAFRARDFLGHYVQHCHNTMHEDHAMLLRWDSRTNKAERVPTPYPTFDGVFFNQPGEVAITSGGLGGDGQGPARPLP